MAGEKNAGRRRRRSRKTKTKSDGEAIDADLDDSKRWSEPRKSEINSRVFLPPSNSLSSRKTFRTKGDRERSFANCFMIYTCTKVGAGDLCVFFSFIHSRLIFDHFLGRRIHSKVNGERRRKSRTGDSFESSKKWACRRNIIAGVYIKKESYLRDRVVYVRKELWRLSISFPSLSSSLLEKNGGSTGGEKNRRP